MHIEFTNTFEDYKTAMKAHRGEWEKWKQRLLVALLAIIGVTYAYETFSSKPKPDGTVLLSLIVIFSTLCAVLYSSAHQELRRRWSGQPTQHVQQQWDISETGIKTDNGVSSSEMKWAAFRRHLDRPTLFMLYTSEFYFHIVPKRAFAGEAQVEEFRELLRRHIQPQTQAFPVISRAEREQPPL
jgi:hypothetical protein